MPKCQKIGAVLLKGNCDTGCTSHRDIHFSLSFLPAWNSLMLSVAWENEIIAVIHLALSLYQVGVHPTGLSYLCWSGHHTCARQALPLLHFPWSNTTYKSNVSLCRCRCLGAEPWPGTSSWSTLVLGACSVTVMASGGLMSSWDAVWLWCWKWNQH